MSTTVLERPAVSSGLLTAEEYFATGPAENTELVDGRIVELMPTNFDHGDIAGTIFAFLKAFLRTHKLGRASVEAGYVLQRNPDKVRAPDVSFVEAGRLEGADTSKFLDFAPTLAVEIISPNDLWHEVEAKLDVYFAAGTKVVWLVDPKRQTVTVRRPGGPAANYIVGETIPGSEILPGFELPVADIFA